MWKSSNSNGFTFQQGDITSPTLSITATGLNAVNSTTKFTVLVNESSPFSSLTYRYSTAVVQVVVIPVTAPLVSLATANTAKRINPSDRLILYGSVSMTRYNTPIRYCCC